MPDRETDAGAPTDPGPDVTAKNDLASGAGQESDSGLGESIAWLFDKVLDDQLGADRGAKSFHSFRHYVADRLKALEVDKDVRMDLLGHSGGDIHSEVYGSGTSLARRAAAIALLPGIGLAPNGTGCEPEPEHVSGNTSATD